MRSMILIVSILFSLNTFAEYCEGIPVVKRGKVFCYKPLPPRYANLNEIDFSNGGGPMLPGWKTGIITQLEESLDNFIKRDFKRSIGLLRDVYSQNLYIISIETKRSKRRLLVKAIPYMEDAIFLSRVSRPNQAKFKKLINKAIKYFQKYTDKD